MSVTSQSEITLQVPAKINPHIRVGPLQQDGYHDITLAYQEISIYDTLKIRHHPNGPTILANEIDSDGVPSTEQNLVIKAAKILTVSANIEPLLHFDLFKCIPSEAGLGGGSADATAALVKCNLLWNLKRSEEDLMQLGAYVGEDVPFFIKGIMAIGLGHKQPLIEL